MLVDSGERKLSRTKSCPIAENPIPDMHSQSRASWIETSEAGCLLEMAIRQRVRRKAINAFLSSAERFSPNSWPFTARLFVPGGPINPVGT